MYSILSIGDGLVNQIPSVIIAVSSGFLVTKISSRYNVGQDLSRQLLKASQPLTIVSFIIAAMVFVPGLPKIPFILLSIGAAMLARNAYQSEKDIKDKQGAGIQPKAEKQPIEELLEVDRVSVQVGVRLIAMVDPRKGSSIFDRIGALRRKFAQQLGIIIPLVRLKDNINLEPSTYEIRLAELAVAKGRLEPDMFLAMDSGTAQGKVDGIKTTEPVFGLPALWITAANKEKAELNGYTVIDSESVFITHLSETLKSHAGDLLTREDVQLLMDRLRKTQPSLVGEVVGPDKDVPIGLLQRILKSLIKDGIPIRELTGILESLGEHAGKTKNAAILTEMVRKRLARTITEQHKNQAGQIQAVTLDAALENQMASTIQQDADSISLALPAQMAMDINRKIADAWKKVMDQGREKVVLLCDSRLRWPVSVMLSRTVPMLPVVAYDEVVLGTEIEPIETISIQKIEPVELKQTQDAKLQRQDQKHKTEAVLSPGS
jgi:flagellar biosynthesis protein FlhA